MRRRLLFVGAIVTGLALAFLAGRESRRPYDVQLTVNTAPPKAGDTDPADGQARIHVLRLRYFGKDPKPGVPPTAAELAYYQASLDAELLEARRKEASLKFEELGIPWDQYNRMSPNIKRTMKALHDVALATQADAITGLEKQIAAMESLMAEEEAAGGTPDVSPP